MQAITTPTRPRRAGQLPHARRGIRIAKIEGRFRPITVHQLAMVWWLYHNKHITLKQLRIYFAAHEMAERRRYTKPDETTGERRRPEYTLDEIKKLVGQRVESESADKALSAEVKKLGRLGLVKISTRSIDFAVSVDQLAVDDITSFWPFLEQLPNNRRTVPVPRRTVRALAGGFTRTMTGLMIAMMIRSLFWHRPRKQNKHSGQSAGQGGLALPGGSREKSLVAADSGRWDTQRVGQARSSSRQSNANETSGGGGEFRVDGRTKCSWVAEVFGLARRGVTDAWARLVELGWIEPIETPQWQLNKWGQHYTIGTGAFAAGWKEQHNLHPPPETSEPSEAAGVMAGQCQDEQQGGQEGADGSAVPHHRGGVLSGSACSQGPANDRLKHHEPEVVFASPNPHSGGDSARPCLNNSAYPSDKYLNTRTPAPQRSGPPAGSREKKSKPPSIRRVVGEDLRDTRRLLELHEQFVEDGLDFRGEAGRLDFIALAERARAVGNQPVRLFVWLVRNHRTEFITQADEDRAAERLRRWIDPRNEADERERQDRALDQGEPWAAGERAPGSTGSVESTSVAREDFFRGLSEDEKTVLACIKLGRKHKVEPFRIARTKGWDRERWDLAKAGYELKERQRWAT